MCGCSRFERVWSFRYIFDPSLLCLSSPDTIHHRRTLPPTDPEDEEAAVEDNEEEGGIPEGNSGPVLQPAPSSASCCSEGEGEGGVAVEEEDPLQALACTVQELRIATCVVFWVGFGWGWGGGVGGPGTSAQNT